MGTHHIRNWTRRAIIAVISFVFALCCTGVANANMAGYDISNWQCGIDTSAVPGDFVVVGTTWGTGQANNPRQCLTGGVNRDANRMIATARSSGKRIGVYHYAMGGNPVAEADFFIDNNVGYIQNAILVLDWESGDNPAFGNPAWPRQWAERVQQRTGVNPVIYVSDSAYWQVAGMENTHNTGVWIAQYANMSPTGYQPEPWNSGARGETMRQYSSNGRLPGWGGPLDVDIFYGDADAWDRIAHPNADNGAVSPPTVPAPSVNGSDSELADRVMRGEFGTIPERQALLGSRYDAVQAIVNQRLGIGGGSGAAANGSCLVVSSGDSLSSIATRLGTSWQNLTGYRSGDPNRIYPGETVCAKGAQPAGQSGHVVVSGESLWTIYGTGWTAAAARNGISAPYTIYPGQVLR